MFSFFIFSIIRFILKKIKKIHKYNICTIILIRLLLPLGVASALRVHMGYIAGLVPGTKAASTCQVDAQGTHSPHARCGSGPIISITSEEDRRLSLGLRRKESSEPRVNFSLPPRE